MSEKKAFFSLNPHFGLQKQPNKRFWVPVTHKIHSPLMKRYRTPLDLEVLEFVDVQNQLFLFKPEPLIRNGPERE